MSTEDIGTQIQSCTKLQSEFMLHRQLTSRGHVFTLWQMQGTLRQCNGQWRRWKLLHIYRKWRSRHSKKETAFLEIMLFPKCANNFLGGNQSSSQSDTSLLVKVLVETCHFHNQYKNCNILIMCYPLRTSENLTEKIIIRTMVKISRCSEQVFTLEDSIICSTVREVKWILSWFWLSQTL